MRVDPSSFASTPRPRFLSPKVSTNVAYINLLMCGNLRESLPQLASVAASSQCLVSIKDTVTGAQESRVARLQLHALEHQLHRQVPAVPRHRCPVCAVVALMEGREGVGAVSPAVFQVPEDFVQNGGPDGTDAVDGLVTGGADDGVGQRVSIEVGAVRVRPDALAVGPVAHGVVLCPGVGGLQANGSGEPITPTFTHTTSLESGETLDVGRTTSETGGETVGVLNKYVSDSP